MGRKAELLKETRMLKRTSNKTMEYIDIKDERIIQLYCQYGAEGLGIFYYLYGRLMLQPSILKTEDMSKISRVLRVKESLIEEIINDSGIFTVIDGVLHCKEIDDALSFKKERSELRRKAVQKRWRQQKMNNLAEPFK